MVYYFFCSLHCLDPILYPLCFIWNFNIWYTNLKKLEAKQKTTYLASFPFVSLSQGILSESLVTDPNDHIFTLVDDMVEPGKNSVNAGSCEELLVCDEEGERSVASVEDQLHKEMIVYEVCNIICSWYTVNFAYANGVIKYDSKSIHAAFILKMTSLVCLWWLRVAWG